jgi:3-hydroxybutyryl-CoA dehydratase
MLLDAKQIQAGMALPAMLKLVRQADINLYARASRDFNPIHIDEEFARKTTAGGTIAHGMLTLAYISQWMTDSFGRDWLAGGKLNVRFKAPARPGDTLTIQGKVRTIQKNDDGPVNIICEVQCTNQKGETVITGEAGVRTKTDENIN